MTCDASDVWCELGVSVDEVGNCTLRAMNGCGWGWETEGAAGGTGRGTNGTTGGEPAAAAAVALRSILQPLEVCPEIQW